MVPILREVKAGERCKWKDIADSISIYKIFSAQWNSLVARDGVLERNWEPPTDVPRQRKQSNSGER
jgi:hypothetical protein